MTPAIRRAALALMLAGVGLAGCGSSATSRITPPYQVEHIPGSSVTRIVLTPIGAQRIGIQTASAANPGKAAGKAGATAVIPYSAVVYDPNGNTSAFTNPSPLTYTEVPITVQTITGQTVYLTQGPSPGTHVVTVGAEELLGVQTGVLAQT
jgi:hypothetical protein